MTNMRKWNYIVAVIIALLGGAVIAINAQYPIEFGAGDPGAGFWPTMLGGLLIVLAVVLAVMTTKNKDKESSKTFSISLPANFLVYQFMGLTVLFCVVMYFLGLIVAALLFIPVAAYMLGARGQGHVHPGCAVRAGPVCSLCEAAAHPHPRAHLAALKEVDAL